MQGHKGERRFQIHRAMLSHELRNAVNGIVGASQLLVSSKLNLEQMQLLNTVRQSAGQLGWLIKNLDPDGGHVEFPFSPKPSLINGVDLLEQAIRCHTPSAALNDNLLLLSVEPGLPSWWLADAHLLRLVIDNLLGNAIKYTRCGEVLIEVTRHSGRRQPAGLDFRVTDTGPGISTRDALTVFKPWVQLENDWATGGQGLGLHVCQRIVSSLKGQIEHLDEAGCGACFRVSLPQISYPQSYCQATQISSLFASVSCQVTAGTGLRRSIISILARLGIHTKSAAGEVASDTDRNFQVLIREAGLTDPNIKLKNSLIFTVQATPGCGWRLPASRLLQAPFLESTLGPLLMEMALEMQLAASSRAPANFEPGDRPD